MADILTLKKFEALSPFEIKDELINLAKATSRTTQSAFLNAGRGNPNWIATTPREGFFLLGQFALTESTRVMQHPAGIGGMPQASGIADRFEGWLAKHADMPGAGFLTSMTQFAVKTFKFDRDAFVHELVDSIIGDNYPVPDRMLVHNEQIVQEYLMWAMCGQPRPAGKFDLYAVEGGTAAMCYIFKSLKANRLLHPGDTIALGTPIFTPYLEMTHLEDYDLKVVHVKAPQENRFQYTDEEIKKLEDPKIKAFETHTSDEVQREIVLQHRKRIVSAGQPHSCHAFLLCGCEATRRPTDRELARRVQSLRITAVCFLRTQTAT